MQISNEYIKHRYRIKMPNSDIEYRCRIKMQNQPSDSLLGARFSMRLIACAERSNIHWRPLVDGERNVERYQTRQPPPLPPAPLVLPPSCAAVPPRPRPAPPLPLPPTATGSAPPGMSLRCVCCAAAIGTCLTCCCCVARVAASPSSPSSSSVSTMICVIFLRLATLG